LPLLLFFSAERDQAQKTSDAIGMIDGDLSDEQDDLGLPVVQ